MYPHILCVRTYVCVCVCVCVRVCVHVCLKRNEEKWSPYIYLTRLWDPGHIAQESSIHISAHTPRLIFSTPNKHTHTCTDTRIQPPTHQSFWKTHTFFWLSTYTEACQIFQTPHRPPPHVGPLLFLSVACKLLPDTNTHWQLLTPHTS